MTRKPKGFFKHRVEVSSSGCWLWARAVNERKSGSRGVYRDGDKLVKAHRGVWHTWFGPIPEGMSVLHACDTPRCCNPDHLFLGTHAENMADMVRKGRSNKGSRHPLAKLTESGVKAIRRKLKAGVKGIEIAAMYGVSPATISGIKHQTRWTEGNV